VTLPNAWVGRTVPAVTDSGEAPLAQRWKILVTGATGRIGFPIARALAQHHEVFGMARCRTLGDADRLTEAGITPVAADVAALEPSALPDGLTHIFHAAALVGPEARSDWQKCFEVNAQAAGRLVAACAGARSFVYCSTGSAYAYQGQRPLREDDPPGVHLGNYSLSKIAGEAVVRFAATEHGVPLTIIRIFSTYGPQGGAPVDRLRRIVEGKDIVLHPDAPNNYNPIYEDDYVRLGIRALEVASLDPVLVNWAGSETVSAEDYCTYLGELVGRPARIRYDDAAPWPLWPDVTKMHEVLGRTEIPWQEGMRRIAAGLLP
jgi:UDP-glucuronate 4-epimerase